MADNVRNEIVNTLADSNASVSLTITIGNAQIGGSIIRRKDTDEIIFKGAVEKLQLGLGSELKGKTLNIKTRVLDVNDQTNGVVVTYFFQSCIPAATMFDDKVINEGDVFTFDVDFNFN